MKKNILRKIKMIKLEKPIYDQEQIIDDCISNMVDKADSPKSRILASKQTIIDKSKEYDNLATVGKLSSLSPSSNVDGGATKNDMTKLYTNKFASQNQGGRKYYDKIKLLAPYGKCPLCGQRLVSTLDHYLPKSSFPLYSITPYNLIPCCSDCNKDKHAIVPSSRIEETIHPYYDDFTDATWIKAKLIKGDPITFEFYVVKPSNWDDLKYKRACFHFKEYNLNKLYKPYACEKFACVLPGLRKLVASAGKAAAIESIKERIEEERVLQLNTWQAAFYEAILDSDWFWNEYLSE